MADKPRSCKVVELLMEETNQAPYKCILIKAFEPCWAEGLRCYVTGINRYGVAGLDSLASTFAEATKNTHRPGCVLHK